MPRFRSLKTHLRALLASAEWEKHLDDIVDLPGKGAVGPLLSSLLLGGEAKWRAVVALGRVVARIADANMEDARIIMRRLMWHMNEESGNIGWGIPEAFGEILACHPRLADEYHRILVSYVRETGKDDNYCDHAPLRRGVYWAIGRLAQERPDLPGFVETATPALLAGLADCDLPARGTAAWALGVLATPAALSALPTLGDLRTCDAPVEHFERGRLLLCTVGELAQCAAQRIEAHCPPASGNAMPEADAKGTAA